MFERFFSGFTRFTNSNLHIYIYKIVVYNFLRKVLLNCNDTMRNYKFSNKIMITQVQFYYFYYIFNDSGKLYFYFIDKTILCCHNQSHQASIKTNAKDDLWKKKLWLFGCILFLRFHSSSLSLNSFEFFFLMFQYSGNRFTRLFILSID